MPVFSLFRELATAARHEIWWTTSQAHGLRSTRKSLVTDLDRLTLHFRPTLGVQGQEGGYARYGVDEIANGIGRSSYGPFSVRPQDILGLSEEEFIDQALQFDSAAVLAAVIAGNKASLVESSEDNRELRVFLAYSLSNDGIQNLNSSDWVIDDADLLDGTKNALRERTSYYLYWKRLLNG